MVKTVIVPLDGSAFAERALGPAHALARQSDAALVLAMSRLGGVIDPARYLQATADRMSIGPVRIVVFDHRLAASAIPELAEAEPDALICMATHARSGAGVACFGSIGEAIMQASATPVVLVGPSVDDVEASKFAELIVCLDGSRHARAILGVAASFARDLGLDPWLVGVVDRAGRVDSGTPDVDDVMESTALQHTASTLEESGVKAEWETLHGENPARAIVEFAQSRRAPLIAMTTHGRTGLARVVAGSVTMAVVRRATCPVLVVRSEALSR